jgi:hypothetical protein
VRVSVEQQQQQQEIWTWLFKGGRTQLVFQEENNNNS